MSNFDELKSIQNSLAGFGKVHSGKTLGELYFHERNTCQFMFINLLKSLKKETKLTEDYAEAAIRINAINKFYGVYNTPEARECPEIISIDDLLLDEDSLRFKKETEEDEPTNAIKRSLTKGSL